MIEMNAVIQNERGIHVRPACVIYKAVEHCEECVTLTFREQKIPIGSIMDLICLGLSKGDIVNISVTGADENRLCARLVELFETRFDFPARETEENSA